MGASSLDNRSEYSFSTIGGRPSGPAAESLVSRKPFAVSSLEVARRWLADGGGHARPKAPAATGSEGRPAQNL